MEAFDRQRITYALTAAAIDPARWSEALETVAVCTRSYGALRQAAEKRLAGDRARAANGDEVRVRA